MINKDRYHFNSIKVFTLFPCDNLSFYQGHYKTEFLINSLK
jgi:hypothetical protein